MSTTQVGQEPTRQSDADHEAARERFRQRIERVKAGCRIDDVAARYGQTRRSGIDRMVCRCLCGENADRNPSFMLWPADGHFNCFACGRHGSVIDLVILAEGLAGSDERRAFRDALEILERDIGVDSGTSKTRYVHRPPHITQAPYPLSEADQRALNATTDWYHAQLLERLDEPLIETRDDVGMTLRQYLVGQRGLSLETIRRLKLGYSDGQGLIRRIHRLGLPVARLAEIGLINSQFVEHLRQRIIFPVLRGNDAVYLIGRATQHWQDEVKYLGLPSGVSSKQPMIAGSPKRGAIFVEGAVDFAVLVQWSLDSEWLIVGLLGTAFEQVIERLSASAQLPPDALIVTDQDWAGKRAALSMSTLMAARGMRPHVLVDADRHAVVSAWVARVEKRLAVSAREAAKLPHGQSEVTTVAALVKGGFAHWVNWGNKVKDPGDLGMRGDEGKVVFVTALNQP